MQLPKKKVPVIELGENSFWAVYKVIEFGQKMAQSHTTDPPMAP